MRTNLAVKTEPIFTHGGGRATHVATHVDGFSILKRSVLACLLWEDSFYEKGSDTANRIASLVPLVKPEQTAILACEARDRMNLRHVPLFLVSELSKIKGTGPLVENTLAHVIQRADELAEFVSIYWKSDRIGKPGKHPLSAGVKRGLARAFGKFSGYSLAKYNRDAAIKLRDVLFLCHAKPKDEEQAALWRSLVDGTLPAPDTWEVELSAGKDKRETFERLMREKKLGGLALLRNLRGMIEAHVDETLIRESLTDGVKRAFPYRFIAAAKAAPRLEDAIEQAMFRSIAEAPKLKGKTVLVIDVSGSMYHGSLSAKSDMNRSDAAAALAILVREVCEQPVLYATAGNDGARRHQTEIVPNRRGFGLSELITNNGKLCRSLGGGGIFLTQVMDFIASPEQSQAERIIVITDEQDCETDSAKCASKAKAFGRFNYIINVGAYKNGIGAAGKWEKIDGWSEAVIDYIREVELLETGQPQ